ncbi:hypothetical protein ACFQ60_22280 [Streptomyces zhihengii]
MRVLGRQEHQPVRGRATRRRDQSGHGVELGTDHGPQRAAAHLVLGTPVLSEDVTDPLGGAEIGAAGRVPVRDAFAEGGGRIPGARLVLCHACQFARHLQPLG